MVLRTVQLGAVEAGITAVAFVGCETKTTATGLGSFASHAASVMTKGRAKRKSAPPSVNSNLVDLTST